MTTFKQFLESGMSKDAKNRDTEESDREYIAQNQKKAQAQIDDAKVIINKARHDLGRELGGYSVRDLLLDNMALRSDVVDRIIRLLRKEGFLSDKHHGG